MDVDLYEAAVQATIGLEKLIGYVIILVVKLWRLAVKNGICYGRGWDGEEE